MWRLLALVVCRLGQACASGILPLAWRDDLAEAGPTTDLPTVANAASLAVWLLEPAMSKDRTPLASGRAAHADDGVWGRLSMGGSAFIGGSCSAVA